MEAVAKTEATCHAAPATPNAAARAQRHGKDQRYFDLMAYIVSNTISGEIMAVENYSEMVPLMATTDAKIETVKQALEETKHIKMLASLGKRLDYAIKTEIIEPQWRKIREHFSTAVKKKNLASCLIIQDLMTETMAIVLYKTLQRDTDPDTAQVASLILVDELEDQAGELRGVRVGVALQRLVENDGHRLRHQVLDDQAPCQVLHGGGEVLANLAPLRLDDLVLMA